MKYVLDTHTHTIASGHAYSTMKEMIQQAHDIGLSLLAITEHAPNMPGSCHPFYFQNFRVLKNHDFGLPVLFGAELNIIDNKGSVDLDDHTLDQLSITIASMHNPCIQVGNAKENTDAYIGAMQNPRIDIIGHPDDARIPIEYERFIEAAKKNGVAIELNNSSLVPGGFRVGAYDNDLTYLNLCKKYEVPVCLGSDAHVYYDVANFTYAQKVLEEIDFPESLILNTSVDKLMAHLRRNRSKL